MIIREARLDDAPILVAAQKETARIRACSFLDRMN